MYHPSRARMRDLTSQSTIFPLVLLQGLSDQPVRAWKLFPPRYPETWSASPAVFMRFWKCALPFGPESALGLPSLVAACSRNLALDFSPWGIVLMSEGCVLSGRQKRHCVRSSSVRALCSESYATGKLPFKVPHKVKWYLIALPVFMCKKKRHPAFWMWKSHPWMVVIEEEEEEWNEKRESGPSERDGEKLIPYDPIW